MHAVINITTILQYSKNYTKITFQTNQIQAKNQIH